MCLTPGQGALKKRTRFDASAGSLEGPAEKEPGGGEIVMTVRKLPFELSKACAQEGFPRRRVAGRKFRRAGVHSRHRRCLMVLAEAALDERERLASKVPRA
jgi:hypothetical protein